MSGFPSCFPMQLPSSKASGSYLRKPTPSSVFPQSSRNDLLHFYEVAEEKTHVVPHGFSPLQLRAEGLAEQEIGTSAPYLLYVGSRAGYKNFGLLLEAFSRSGLAGSYRLLAVGGGAFSTEEQAELPRSVSPARSPSFQRPRMRSSRALTANAASVHLSQPVRRFRLSPAGGDEPGMSGSGQSDVVLARGLRRRSLLLRLLRCRGALPASCGQPWRITEGLAIEAPVGRAAGEAL